MQNSRQRCLERAPKGQGWIALSRAGPAPIRTRLTTHASLPMHTSQARQQTAATPSRWPWRPILPTGDLCTGSSLAPTSTCSSRQTTVWRTRWAASLPWARASPAAASPAARSRCRAAAMAHRAAAAAPIATCTCVCRSTNRGPRALAAGMATSQPCPVSAAFIAACVCMAAA